MGIRIVDAEWHTLYVNGISDIFGYIHRRSQKDIFTGPLYPEEQVRYLERMAKSSAVNRFRTTRKLILLVKVVQFLAL